MSRWIEMRPLLWMESKRSSNWKKNSFAESSGRKKSQAISGWTQRAISKT
jgi:hypothetical protein